MAADDATLDESERAQLEELAEPIRQMNCTNCGKNDWLRVNELTIECVGCRYQYSSTAENVLDLAAIVANGGAKSQRMAILPINPILLRDILELPNTVRITGFKWDFENDQLLLKLEGSGLPAQVERIDLTQGCSTLLPKVDALYKLSDVQVLETGEVKSGPRFVEFVVR